ncbi:MAG: Holliday junction branch migration protein RuvA [Candidatus Melainabacteria bacterium]|nr:Holliday junction branch migration protein RuvA [Candidatus Melainabacteria bacterium]
MFAFLKGTIAHKELSTQPVDRLLLDVSGVGFEIWMAQRNLSTIGEVGEDVIVHTFLAVRETELTIFGFETQDERQLFQTLKTVTGVGPKLALSIIGTLGLNHCIDSIVNQDDRVMSQAPGVGPKLAKRIMLELKSKMDEFAPHAMKSSLPVVKDNMRAIFDETRLILEGLGYTATEINMALDSVKKDNEFDNDPDVEMLVQLSLRALGKASVK